MDSAAFFASSPADKVVKSVWTRKRPNTTKDEGVCVKKRPCQHKVIQVVLNPSKACVVTASVTNEDGNVLANVCVNCSEMQKEGVFGLPKARKPHAASHRIRFADNADTLRWFQSSPFTRAHENIDGIYMYSEDKNMNLPQGAYWESTPSVESIVVGRLPQEKMYRQPLTTILGSLQQRLKLQKQMDST
jgi:hypothetical protein